MPAAQHEGACQRPQWVLSRRQMVQRRAIALLSSSEATRMPGLGTARRSMVSKPLSGTPKKGERCRGGHSMSIDCLPALRSPRPAWNKSRLRAEAAAPSQARVVHSRPTGAIGQQARPCPVQHGRRQQAPGCDLVCLRVRDVFAAGHVKELAAMIQSKTGKPVRFEITESTRQSLEPWIADPEMGGVEFLWPSRLRDSPHLSTRQYARILRGG